MTFVVALAFVNEASARSSVCTSLERQLASAGSPPSRGSDKYARSARAQIQQLQIARAQARKAGCGGLESFLDGTNSSACPKITSTIRRMESNLTSLQNKASGSNAARPNRSRILAALAANECSAKRAGALNAKRKPLASDVQQPSLFTKIFGGTLSEKQVVSYSVINETEPTTKKQVKVISGGKSIVNLAAINQYDSTVGTVRTMCVRTCDGYYFPVSFSTTSSHFSRDEKVCAAMCPGAETKLYHHNVLDQEPEEMISLRKEPYAESATAFNYRRDGIGANLACTCQAQPENDTAMDVTNRSLKKTKWVPYPSSKPSLLEDEEARLNRIGNLDATAIHNLLKPMLSNETLASKDNVRVVGPAFLPSQSGAVSLPAQARSRVQ